MSFTISDAEDLVRLLREHPEWKARVRMEVLGEELLSLPDLVRQNSADIRALQAVVAQNSADIRQNSADIRQNSEDIRNLQAEVSDMARRFDARFTQVEGRLGHLHGTVTEFKWAQNFAGRFGTIVRRSRLVSPRDLARFEAADEAGEIDDAAALGVRQADILVEGVIGRGREQRDVVLVVEVSTTIEAHDVDRAIVRAATLRGLGYDAIAVVAGALMDDSLRNLALAQSVEVLLRPEDITGFAVAPAAGA